MMNEVGKLEAEIRVRQAELTRLKEQEGKIASGDPEVIADALHGKECWSNHTDGCGWSYESWSQRGSTRLEWLARAQRLIAFAKENNVPITVALAIRWLR